MFQKCHFSTVFRASFLNSRLLLRREEGQARAAEALFKANKCILQRALENETQRMMPTFWRLILHLNLNVACINLWWQLGILYDFFSSRPFLKEGQML